MSSQDHSMSYLEENLLPLILDIKTPKTDSYIMIAAGLGDNTSQSSVLIQVGNKLEIFWNNVISACTTNLIEENNKIKVNGKNRQLDHLFGDDLIYYLESKCNLNFDTEKKPASNDKIEAVCAAVNEKYDRCVFSGYFVPCIREIPADVKKKYPNVNIYGVEWLLDTLNCDLFTADEFFAFFKEVVGPILEEKIYG
jgi:hypothetical protein